MHKIKEELDQLALSLEIQHQVKEQHKRYKEIEEKNKMLTKYHMISEVKDMIYIADLGLYNAKRKGRNQYDVYEKILLFSYIILTL